MSREPNLPRLLVNRRWVHVDGDDTDDGAVYRDAAADLPLSRRPKDYLEFSTDGTVRRFATGADDRAHETDRADWRDEGGDVSFRFDVPDARGRRVYRIVDYGADRLVIRGE